MACGLTAELMTAATSAGVEPAENGSEPLNTVVLPMVIWVTAPPPACTPVTVIRPSLATAGKVPVCEAVTPRCFG